MKTCLALTTVLLSTASFAAPRTANFSARTATPLHFARGATTLRARGYLSGSQRRFYTLKTRGGQKLRISAQAARGGQVVPLIQVTPPRGRYDGDKTGVYTTNFSRAGTYKIEIAPNMMASNARSGPFVLSVSAR